MIISLFERGMKIIATIITVSAFTLGASPRFLVRAFSSSAFRLTRSQPGSQTKFITVRRPNIFLEAADEDIDRWEQMYNGGRSSYLERDMSEVSQASSEIRVVTFDLDNTLWNTSATISAANDALAAFLDEQRIHQPKRVEKVMGELFKASRESYCPLAGQDGKAPVLLTKLRKDAMRQVLMDHNGFSESDAVDFAEQAFQVWTTARHQAIPNHYASSVVTCLERIGSLRTSSGQPVLVGAVTDGNSDPRNIPELRNVFQFCVNAEGVGVSKPDKRLYLEAIKHIQSHPLMEDVFGPLESSLTAEAAEDLLGPWWVHIGDDFVKDIVASKDLKMRSIWSRELVLDKEASSQQANAPTRTTEQFVKEISEMKVVEMSIGADDYLADSLRREFADAVVDSFDEIHTVLHGWQEMASKERSEWAPEEVNSILQQESLVEPNVQSSSTTNEPPKVGEIQSTKFCLYCGDKLPRAAMFCSSCGEEQPVLAQAQN